MKKSLIALAVLAASGAAMAQSTVTLYGVADIGLAYKQDGSTSTTALDSGNLNGSRWGLKGTEDLGGGLKAIFTIESGFNLDTGAQADAARSFNRQAWVGVDGGFGTVKVGRLMNPIFSNSGTFDPFGDALSGDSARLLNYQGNRTDNTMSYAYAASGFRGEVQYGFGEVAGNSSASRTLGLVLGYKNGPIDVVLTSEQVNNATNTDSTKVTLLGGNYDFGVAKAFLTIDSEKGVGTVDRRHVIVGAKAPIGQGNAMISYIKRTDNAGANLDANQWAVGYVYDMSKRTAIYTSYGVTSNDPLAKAQVTTAGTDAKKFLLGVRHSF